MHLLVWTMTRKYCKSLKHHLAVQQCTFHPYSPLCLTSALIQSGLEKRNETSSAVWSHQKSFGIRRAPARKAREGRGETLQYGMFSTCPACRHRQSVQRYSFRISTVCFECEVMKQTTMLQNTVFWICNLFGYNIKKHYMSHLCCNGQKQNVLHCYIQ